MNVCARFKAFHAWVRRNRWYGYFALFNRIALAAGFIPSGMVKIMGERFTALDALHPMGSYLEALHHTGYYYTFIGVAQVTAALLLLIPRTVLVGALLYFPIILNICILSLAVRFDGSLLSAPLMVLANLYLLFYYSNRLKSVFIAPLPKTQAKPISKSKFPFRFFAFVFACTVSVGILLTQIYDVMPRNTISECQKQFEGEKHAQAGMDFCNCIHQQGLPLNQCLEAYENAIKMDENPY